MRLYYNILILSSIVYCIACQKKIESGIVPVKMIDSISTITINEAYDTSMVDIQVNVICKDTSVILEEGILIDTVAITTKTSTKFLFSGKSLSFKIQMKNLLPGKTYHIAGFAIGTSGFIYGNEVQINIINHNYYYPYSITKIISDINGNYDSSTTTNIFKYDSVGRVIQFGDTKYSYQNNLIVSLMETGNNLINFNYDSIGRLSRIYNPLIGYFQFVTFPTNLQMNISYSYSDQSSNPTNYSGKSYSSDYVFNSDSNLLFVENYIDNFSYYQPAGAWAYAHYPYWTTNYYSYSSFKNPLSKMSIFKQIPSDWLASNNFPIQRVDSSWSNYSNHSNPNLYLTLISTDKILYSIEFGNTGLPLKIVERSVGLNKYSATIFNYK